MIGDLQAVETDVVVGRATDIELLLAVECDLHQKLRLRASSRRFIERA